MGVSYSVVGCKLLCGWVKVTLGVGVSYSVVGVSYSMVGVSYSVGGCKLLCGGCKLLCGWV